MLRTWIDEDVCQLQIVKGDETYTVQYTDATVLEALQSVMRWAKDPELSFSFADAAVMNQRIRQLAKG